VSNDRLFNELEKALKVAIVAYIEVMPQPLLGGSEENHENPQLG
jgi:hypothetical protein